MVGNGMVANHAANGWWTLCGWLGVDEAGVEGMGWDWIGRGGWGFTAHFVYSALSIIYSLVCRWCSRVCLFCLVLSMGCQRDALFQG